MSQTRSVRSHSFRRVLIAGTIWGPVLGALAALGIFVAAAIVPGSAGFAKNSEFAGWAILVGGLWGLISGSVTSAVAVGLGALSSKITGRAVVGLTVGAAATAFLSTWWFFAGPLTRSLVVSLTAALICAVIAIFVVLTSWLSGSPRSFLTRQPAAAPRVG
jgi:hypothetical protein